MTQKMLKRIVVNSLEDIDNIPMPTYDDLEIISRDEWGALPPNSTDQDKPIEPPVPYMVLMQTGTEPCKDKDECVKFVQALQKKDMEERGLSDIQQSFVFDPHGNIYEGRKWDIYPPENSECPDLLNQSMEFLFIGNYVDEPIPYDLSTSAYDLIQILMWRDILHKEYEFRRLVKFMLQKVEDPVQYNDAMTKPKCGTCGSSR